jgi:hypothetical protein
MEMQMSHFPGISVTVGLDLVKQLQTRLAGAIIQDGRPLAALAKDLWVKKDLKQHNFPTVKTMRPGMSQTQYVNACSQKQDPSAYQMVMLMYLMNGTMIIAETVQWF